LIIVFVKKNLTYPAKVVTSGQKFWRLK